MRRAIEDKGTENFPEFGGKKLYGELTMIVSVNFDGQLIETEIVKAPVTACWTAVPR
jgi:protein TonB